MKRLREPIESDDRDMKEAAKLTRPFLGDSHLQRSLSTPTNHLRREFLLQCVSTPAARGPLLFSQQDGGVWGGIGPPKAQRRPNGILSLRGGRHFIGWDRQLRPGI